MRIYAMLALLCTLTLGVRINNLVNELSENLVYLFELNRHGARSPTSIYKNNDTFGFSKKDKG